MNNEEGPSEQRTEVILETESNNESTVKYVEKDPMTLESLLTSNFVQGDCLRLESTPDDYTGEGSDGLRAPCLPEENSDDCLRVEDVESNSDSVVVDHATGERISLAKKKSAVAVIRLVKAEKPPLMHKMTMIDPLSGCNTSKFVDKLCDAGIKGNSDVVSSPATLCRGGGLAVSSDNNETALSNASKENSSKKVATAHSASAVASNERQIIEDPVLQEDRVEAPPRTRPKRTEKCPKQWQDHLLCSDDKKGFPSFISVFSSHCGPPVQVSSGPPLGVIECNPGT